ncbi:DNA repair protein RecN [Clostridium cellulovorans]|uniref:DNA repair protein RecN n=1 Tax=Clostridium cellulovorans (strain ATCC 35296 / DSM 3052 / OCM 3 / 743B) TaxID=573061 RepID=D9SLV4_CLOC7|nr:DNA repair protein RecN [Clostridium cellulovorans]ADL51685.1 DNA repair protein RecN [Clostridium cellulovorans 743B]
MLLQLNINNFALIENLTINFSEGFTVLTGETGTGKSILIDAISFVLGAKNNRGVIRTGTDKAFVEGIFTVENPKTKAILSSLDIDVDEVLIISRETFLNGKSITKVNNKTVLVSNLRKLADSLMDIHGQHENQNLLDKNTHIDYLDNFGYEFLKEDLGAYKIEYKKLLEVNNSIETICNKNENREKLMDYLKYQIDEINKGKLKIDEDVELEKQHKILSNSENIKKSLSISYNVLYEGSDEKTSIFDNLSYVIKELRNVSMHHEDITTICSGLEDTYYNLEQSISDIRSLKDEINYDQGELDFINNRLYIIDGYKRKYGETIKDILDYKTKIENEYAEMINSEEILATLRKDKEKIIMKLKGISLILNDKRVEVARRLKDVIQEQLNYIGLEKSNFYIEINYDENCLDEYGASKVQFLISTNPGEPLLPLERVVSGGELSRIMLALKTAFVDKDKIPSVIFDEIDTGISGRVAQSVAEKMYMVSLSHQVFCVTHLPQIAALSDNHYVVLKEVVDNKTYTNIKILTEDEKPIEMARMLGGSEFTKLTLEHGRELIFLAQNKKKQISST